MKSSANLQLPQDSFLCVAEGLPGNSSSDDNVGEVPQLPL